MCPELADIGQRRLEERYLCLIGTLRRDGWPRISPVEPFLVDGDLMMGMMKGSRKAADLLRDPRLVVHSIVTRWEADEGDVKLYGTAQPVTEPEAQCAVPGDDRGSRLGWATVFCRGSRLSRLPHGYRPRRLCPVRRIVLAGLGMGSAARAEEALPPVAPGNPLTSRRSRQARAPWSARRRPGSGPGCGWRGCDGWRRRPATASSALSPLRWRCV